MVVRLVFVGLIAGVLLVRPAGASDFVATSRAHASIRAVSDQLADTGDAKVSLDRRDRCFGGVQSCFHCLMLVVGFRI